MRKRYHEHIIEDRFFDRISIDNPQEKYKRKKEEEKCQSNVRHAKV